jgi:hypothetical protein
MPPTVWIEGKLTWGKNPRHQLCAAQFSWQDQVPHWRIIVGSSQWEIRGHLYPLVLEKENACMNEWTQWTQSVKKDIPDGGVAQLVKHLLSMYEDLSLIHSTTKHTQNKQTNKMFPSQWLTVWLLFPSLQFSTCSLPFHDMTVVPSVDSPVQTVK